MVASEGAEVVGRKNEGYVKFQMQQYCMEFGVVG